MVDKKDVLAKKLMESLFLQSVIPEDLLERQL